MSYELDLNIHPLLGDLTPEEIHIAASRWLALQKVPTLVTYSALGFTSDETVNAPAQRALSMGFATHAQPSTSEERAQSVSALTDLADLMRAVAIEERHA